MAAMTAAGMGDRERLEDSTDQLASRTQQEEMEMVAHQAVAEEPERAALLGDRHGPEEGLEAVVGKDFGPVVPAI